MKNIKTFDTFNEGLFSKPKEGDKFAKDLIDVIKNENLEIKHKFSSLISIGLNYDYNLQNIYFITLEDNTYIVTEDTRQIIIENNKSKNNRNIYKSYENLTINISDKYVKQIITLYKKQTKIKDKEIEKLNKEQQKQKLERLPDISELGRDIKRFNL